MRKLSTILFLALLSFTTWAYDFQVDQLCYNFNDENPTEVTVTNQQDVWPDCAYPSLSGDITIPSTVTYNGTNYTVTSIGWGAFSGCTSLTSVTIPNTLTSIGTRAFNGCSSLTSVTIPNSVTSIEGDAFSGTALYNDPSNWVNNVLYIDNCLITANSEISGTYNILAGTRVIADDAFYSCSSLTSVTIPEGLTSIGWGAFSGCTSLTSVTIPEGVTSIGEEAFSNCTSLTSITIPNSVTSIESGVFEGCSSLTSITIPNTVTSIGWGAFSGCTSLISVTIPTSVVSIGGWAFSDCSSLTSVTIPEGVTSIEEYAFSNCTSLTSVTIPTSVTSIEDYAFADCTSLTTIQVESGNLSYVSENGILFNADKTALIQYPAGKTETTYTIPTSVTSIGEYAFASCSSLTSLTIPSSVTSIERNAFYGTTLYSDPSNWVNNVLYIDNCLIEANSELSGTYNILAGTRVIASNAFSYCSSLTSVTIPTSVVSIGGWAFSNCSSLTSVTIPEGVTSIEEYVFFTCSSLASVTIPEGVTSIGESAFRYCSSLTSVTIPEGVTSIGTGAFEYCSSLTSVTIPNSVTSIGWYAFMSCSSLTHVTIGTSVTSIGGDAFSGTTLYNDPSNWVNNVLYIDNCLIAANSELSGTYNIVAGTRVIADDAFYSCSSLTSVTIPNNITSIGWGVFENCSSLSSVTIGNGVESIDSYAFYECYSLDTITCLGGNPPVVNAAFETINPETCKLYVPTFALVDYTHAPVWSDFLNIEGIEVDYTLSLTISDGCKIVYQNKEYTETTEISVAGGSDMTFQIPQYESYTNLSVRYNGIEYVSEMDEDGNLTLPTMKGDGKLEITNNATDIIFPTLSHLRAWQANGTIFAEVDDNVATLQLYDVSGRLMNEYRHNGNYQVITLPAPNEVNILKVVGKDGSITAHKLM